MDVSFVFGHAQNPGVGMLTNGRMRAGQTTIQGRKDKRH